MSVRGIYAVISVLLVSLISLIGIAFISISKERMRRIDLILVSLAAGSLFGDAFIHLLPESFAKPETRVEVSIYVLVGILAFFILEKFLRWRHGHSLNSESAIRPVGYMNLVADGAHNLIDGMIIGASYLISTRVGIATTLAVILHEIPQEIGDFGVLIYAGFSRTKALFFNFLSATFAIVGTIIALLVGTSVATFSALMLPLAAGGFIYIAGSDLIPALQKDASPSNSAIQLVAMITGAGMMLLLILME